MNLITSKYIIGFHQILSIVCMRSILSFYLCTHPQGLNEIPKVERPIRKWHIGLSPNKSTQIINSLNMSWSTKNIGVTLVSDRLTNDMQLCITNIRMRLGIINSWLNNQSVHVNIHPLFFKVNPHKTMGESTPVIGHFILRGERPISWAMMPHCAKTPGYNREFSAHNLTTLLINSPLAT